MAAVGSSGNTMNVARENNAHTLSSNTDPRTNCIPRDILYSISLLFDSKTFSSDLERLKAKYGNCVSEKAKKNARTTGFLGMGPTSTNPITATSSINDDVYRVFEILLKEKGEKGDARLNSLRSNYSVILGDQLKKFFSGKYAYIKLYKPELIAEILETDSKRSKELSLFVEKLYNYLPVFPKIPTGTPMANEILASRLSELRKAGGSSRRHKTTKKRRHH